jgi:hypothetical protein
LTFLLSEDKALREKLIGMQVSDQKASGEDVPRDVGVWFGMPDQEIRSQSYPYVTIDMVDVIRDTSREMRGKTSSERYPYLFEGQDTPNNTALEADLPIPVNIDYQITSYARHPRHDRQIMAQLMATKLPMRFGVLEVDDNTVRRLDVLDLTKRDMIEQGKRLFMNAVTVRVSSEVTVDEFTQLYKVTSVHLDPPTAERAGGRATSPYYSSLGSQTITEPYVTP